MAILSRRRFMHTASVAALGALGCKASTANEAAEYELPPEEKKRRPVDPAIGDMINAFGVELLPQLKGDAGNRFYSPYSISTALGMTAIGARGRTLEQMQKVLHLPPQSEAADGRYLEITHALNERNKLYQLSTANAIWAQKSYPWRPLFEKRVAHFGAHLQAADFANNAEKERVLINSWVEKQTQNKIRELFASGSLDSLTRMVLVNAIYFKGVWKEAFKKALTRDQPFMNADGSKSTVPLMHDNGQYMLFQNEGLQVLTLPYKGEDLSMMVALPRKVDGLASVEKSLTYNSFSKWREESKPVSNLQVYLPRFKLETTYKLNDSLKQLGMRDAFDDSADFGAMHSSSDRLSITLVMHKAFVEVNEEGTEAAAATGVAVGVRSARPIEMPQIFRADHPFLFAIRHNESGAILFMGRVEKL